MKTIYEVCEFDELFRYKKGQQINDNILLEYIKINNSNGDKKRRGYLCKCVHDGYIRPVEQYEINKRIHSCAVCAGKVVVQGINDIATTQPELVDFIHDKSIVNSITRASTRKIDLECPICHTVKKGTLRDLGRYGFSCPKCSDGRTIPNKLMYLILEKSGLEFECEVYFDWCSFKIPNKIDKITRGIYDFVIESDKLIIEMDGGLGHGKKLHSRSAKTVEETLYRDKMKDKLACEHGYKVIRIDCDYTEDNKYDYMYNALLNSELTDYIDIENLDIKALFDEVNNTSLVKEACLLWNQGKSLGEISERIKYGKVTVRKYLIIGSNVGLCDYDGSISYERGKEQFSNSVYEYSLHFKSARDFANFLEMYDIPLNFHSIKNRFVSKNVDQTVIDGIRIERKQIEK